jgi:molecular chaperone Hsp33
MLNYEDLKEMDGEGQEMVCQYCNNREFIPKEEIEKMVMDAQAKMN